MERAGKGAILPVSGVLPLTHRLVADAAQTQHLIGRVLPPFLGEDLHFVQAAIAGRLDPTAQPWKINHAIAHHAAIEQEIGGWDEPIANMKRENSPLAGALDLRLALRVPPHMVRIDRDADGAALTAIELVAQIKRLAQRIHAGAIGALHRMQRLDG